MKLFRKKISAKRFAADINLFCNGIFENTNKEAFLLLLKAGNESKEIKDKLINEYWFFIRSAVYLISILYAGKHNIQKIFNLTEAYFEVLNSALRYDGISDEDIYIANYNLNLRIGAYGHITGVAGSYGYINGVAHRFSTVKESVLEERMCVFFSNLIFEIRIDRTKETPVTFLELYIEAMKSKDIESAVSLLRFYKNILDQSILFAGIFNFLSQYKNLNITD